MPNDNQLDLLRVPPHSIEAEQSVLGGLMLENIAWDKIADLIGEDDFYRDDHRRIYKHISKLIEANRPADVRGFAIDCGHFIPEEKPEETIQALREFFAN